MERQRQETLDYRAWYARELIKWMKGERKDNPGGLSGVFLTEPEGHGPVRLNPWPGQIMLGTYEQFVAMGGE